MIALTAGGIPGPSAQAASAAGRPELAAVEAQDVVKDTGDRKAQDQLKVLAAAQEDFQKLVGAAEELQGDLAEEAEAEAAAPAGASGAAVASGAAAGTQGAGSYEATPLSPSSSWSAGGSSGSFSWSFPLRMVPSTGPTPHVEITYDSGSVDGRLPSVNNQPSWVGEGFELPTSYVERSYQSCDDDKDSGQGDLKGKFDLCWKNDNATIVLNGKASELVNTGKESNEATVWRLKDDDSTIVEQLSGADNGTNKDKNTPGEYWRVTTPDGTRYTFGAHVLPGAKTGDPRTNSVFTVPVFSDDANEPCHGSSLESSDCVMGWRWNLDYVVDTHENAATYWYEKETNTYAQFGETSDPRSYVRGGYLTRIKYGQRADTLFTAPAGQQVDFTVAERCLIAAARCKELTKATHPYWPDVPFDSLWQENSTGRAGMVSPTFFTRKLLRKVTTSVWNATTKAYRAVDSWTLTHNFLDPGDTGDTSDQSLWLTRIQQDTAADGKPILPAVEFTPIMLWNRVGKRSENIVGLPKPRLRTVKSETGSLTVVTYDDASTCGSESQRPEPSTNTQRCFPVYWSPEGGTQRRMDWFYKYVVTDVISADLTGGSPSVLTHYDYSAKAAWHYAEDPISPLKWRTWNQWRGYEQVTTRVGDTTNPKRSKSVSVYLRGMDGDHLPDGKTRSVQVPRVNLGLSGLTKAEAPAITDAPELAGFVRAQTTYNGENNPISGVWYKPWSKATASFTYPGADYTARAAYVRTAEEHHWTAITSPPDTSTSTPSVEAVTPRLRTTSTTYDDYGMPIQVQDSGDEALDDDQTCELTTYARNPARGLTSLVSRTQKLALACDKMASATLPKNSSTSGDVISDTATVYDTTVTDTTTWSQDQVPTRGDANWSGRASGYATNRTASWQKVVATRYDALGRALAVTNVDGKTNTTSYTPAASEPLTSTTTSNSVQHSTRTDYDPAWRVPVKVVDANIQITEFSYDPLGRLVKVWLPTQIRLGRNSQETNANLRFEYHISNSVPSWVSTSTLKDPAASSSTNTDNPYSTSVAIYDGLLRERQTQVPPATGEQGRVITTSIYDDRGLKRQSDADIFDDDAWPEGTVVEPKTQSAPATTRTTFDAASRPTATEFLSLTTSLWKTTTEYTGDSVATSAPAGGSAIREYTDVTGQVTRRLQYNSPTYAAKTVVDATNQDALSTKADAEKFLRTRFTYTAGGQLATVISPDNSTWTYTYDLFGRQTSAVDPDKGETTTSYNTLDQVKSTENNGNTLIYEYDSLGRKTYLWSHADRAPEHELASWEYDKIKDSQKDNAKGQLVAATRYVWDSQQKKQLAYTKRVTEIDAVYRPLTQKLELPSDDPLIAAGVPKELTFKNSYYADGSLRSAEEPAAAGLSQEAVHYSYNTAGMPAAMGGDILNQIVWDTVYSPLGDIRQIGLGAEDTQKAQVWLSYTYKTGTRRLDTSTVKDGVHGDYQQELQYGYDDAGNVTSVLDSARPGGTGIPDYQCFAYDGYAQLQHAWTPATAKCDPTARKVTALAGPAPYWSQYVYDNTTGQRSSETQHLAHTRMDYTYDQANPHQLKTLTTTVNLDDDKDTTEPGDSVTTAGYTYDAAGNTKTRPSPGGVQHLTWDAEGHLATSRIPGDGQVADRDTSNLYDTDGNLLIRRPTKAGGDGETVLYLGATEVKLTTSNSGKTKALSARRYYTHAGQTVAVRTAVAGGTPKTIYLVGDRNGTSELAIDPGNNMAITRRYTTPFGAPRGNAAKPVAWVDDKGFLGKPVDATTGLTHVGAREYDVSIGRFISVDPVLNTQDPLSLNGYTYASNNPVTRADPTGLDAGYSPSICGYSPENCSRDAGRLGSSNPKPSASQEPNRKGTGDYTPPTPAPVADHGGGGWWNKAKRKLGQARQWTTEHTDVIVDVAVGVAAGIAIAGVCVATVGVGCGVIAAVGAGMLGSMASYGVRVASTSQEFSWADLGKSAFIGAVSGAAGHGVGKLAVRGLAKTRPLLSKAMKPKASATAGGKRGCFVAGTKIATAKGLKRIEQIKIGDRVWSRNPRTGKRELQRVSTTYKLHATALMAITLATGVSLTVTPGHRLYVPQEGWKPVGALAIGAPLVQQDGTTTRITHITRDLAPTTVYNLEVDNNHNYYVGNTPILAHNENCGAGAEEATSAVAHEAPIGPARNTDLVLDSFRGLGAGKQKTVRTVGSVDEMRQTFDAWIVGAERLSARGPKIPDVYQLPDGGVVQWRIGSASGGPAIDINPVGGVPRKVHLADGVTW